MLLYHWDANVHEHRLSAHESTVVIRDQYYQYMLVQFSNSKKRLHLLATWNVKDDMIKRNEVWQKKIEFLSTDCIDMQCCLNFFFHHWQFVYLFMKIHMLSIHFNKNMQFLMSQIAWLWLFLDIFFYTFLTI